MLVELIDLLTCGFLKTIERDEIVHLVQNAPQNPDFSWTSSPEEAMSIELISSLSPVPSICHSTAPNALKIV
jgi:hypothetical protein